MDALSDVLQVVRLGGALYLHGEFNAPWGVVGARHEGLCSAFFASAPRIVSYHLLTEGSCWVELVDVPGSAMQVHAGELIVVPHGEPHILRSAPEVVPTPAEAMMEGYLRDTPGEVMTLRMDGDGDRTRMLCGFLACDESQSNPLLSMLPQLFKVDMRNDPRSAWIESSLQFAAVEASENRAGSALILGKLSELLFVEAIRRCIDAMPATHEGWLAGVRDRFVGRALAMMHAQPSHAWTVDELARKVGLSRSALAQRFNELVGQPPMQYLTRWRLQLAAQELATASKPLIAIASQVGYESEAAFNRAFKREFGMPPSSWRKSRENMAPAAALAT